MNNKIDKELFIDIHINIANKKLRQQQEKQARYIEKTTKLSQKMQETSLRIAQLTGMTLPPSSSSGSKSVYVYMHIKSA